MQGRQRPVINNLQLRNRGASIQSRHRRPYAYGDSVTNVMRDDGWRVDIARNRHDAATIQRVDTRAGHKAFGNLLKSGKYLDINRVS